MYTPFVLVKHVTVSQCFFSLKFRESLQVGCGLYFPGRMGIRSFIGLPKIHMAGESFVVGSGMKNGFLECIDVDCARAPSLALSTL